MDKRCIVEYTGDPDSIRTELESRGARVPYNSKTNRVAIASIPERVIEQIRELDGITRLIEEPL